MSDPSSFGDRVGALLLFETSVVSASAILLLLSYIAVRSAYDPPPRSQLIRDILFENSMVLSPSLEVLPGDGESKALLKSSS
jgi:hypothetical protein